MYSIKNFQILIVLFLVNFQTFGQDNFPRLRQRLDRVFARIDKSQIPYGILEEYSFGFMNLWQVNTQNPPTTDTTKCFNNTAWRMTYATLELVIRRVSAMYSTDFFRQISRFLV